MLPPWLNSRAVSILLAGFCAAISVRAQEFEGPDSARRAAEYLRGRRAGPSASVPPDARYNAVRQLESMRAAESRRAQSAEAAAAISALRWTQIGPQPALAYGVSAGRVSSLAVSRQDPTFVYAGTAEGGVWLTQDGGDTWTPITDDQPSLAVGAMAIDPSNHNILYVGTGEGWAGYGGPGFSGDGGPANQASLNQPVGLALDGLGNLFIADHANGRIRRVAADGTISTVAGVGN